MRWFSRWNAVVLALCLYAAAVAVWLFLHKKVTSPDFSQFKAREPQLTEQQCEALVEQLVNPKEKPYLKKRPDDPPEGFDARAQAPIKAAHDQFSANIEDAFPTLIKHIDDKRFSYVCEEPINGVLKTRSVGNACYKILSAHVEVWHQHTTKPRDEEGRQSFLHPKAGEFDWRENWQGKTLAQLQYEGIDWAVRQPKPDHFKSEAEWARAVKALQQMAREIRDSKRPIKVEHTLDLFPK
jgi:hypothetical protein